MLVFKTVLEYQKWRNQLNEGAGVGFVPTMGALHSGHVSLMEKARSENEFLVVSIFVNPTQFNDPKDCDTYPAPIEADLQASEKVGADAILMPAMEDLYPDSYRFKLSENEYSLQLEGAHRPGHFDGVLTIVLKLFNIVQAHRAYFGEKDWQQLQLIKDMAKSLFIPVEVISCPTVREDDGLAMSSRNVRLDPESRSLAPKFHEILEHAPSAATAHASLRDNGFKVEYVADQEGRRLAAVVLSGVRLIDNVPL